MRSLFMDKPVGYTSRSFAINRNVTTELSRGESTLQATSSSFHQNGYKMKLMDFFVWLGARRRHSCSYGSDEQQRQAEKDAISCIRFGGTDY
jgi:hypothetical protein